MVAKDARHDDRNVTKQSRSVGDANLLRLIVSMLWNFIGEEDHFHGQDLVHVVCKN